jgi:hypothetical protein
MVFKIEIGLCVMLVRLHVEKVKRICTKFVMPIPLYREEYVDSSKHRSVS